MVVRRFLDNGERVVLIFGRGLAEAGHFTRSIPALPFLDRANGPVAAKDS